MKKSKYILSFLIVIISLSILLKGVFGQPPFPENGDAQADAIIGIGYMMAIFLIYIIFLVLMLYFTQKRRKEYIVIIVIYFSQISMAFGTMASPYFPFTPSFQVFILLLYSAIFLQYSLDYYTNYKNKSLKGK